MHDANEMECLIFLISIKNIVIGKVTKSGVSDANNKLIINIFQTVGSYRPQPLRNRVNYLAFILILGGNVISTCMFVFYGLHDNKNKN